MRTILRPIVLAVALAVLLPPLLSAPALAAAEKKKEEEKKKDLASMTPDIDIQSITIAVQGLEKVEYRPIGVTITLTSRDPLATACYKVPYFIDAVITDARANPPAVTKRNVIDPVMMNKRLTALAEKHFPKGSFKTVKMGEANTGKGGVIDRLPTMCK
ncbi:MAG: hypothetical protein HZC25_14475 [Rhodospirillales bacterium]|nr:hypothetical protein [Rhodospirillales bacterium]